MDEDGASEHPDEASATDRKRIAGQVSRIHDPVDVHASIVQQPSRHASKILGQWMFHDVFSSPFPDGELVFFFHVLFRLDLPLLPPGSSMSRLVVSGVVEPFPSSDRRAMRRSGESHQEPSTALWMMVSLPFLEGSKGLSRE